MIVITYTIPSQLPQALQFSLKFETSLEPCLRGFGFTRDRVREMIKKIRLHNQVIFTIPNKPELLTVQVCK
jgi:hypothetical protein